MFVCVAYWTKVHLKKKRLRSGPNNNLSEPNSNILLNFFPGSIGLQYSLFSSRKNINLGQPRNKNWISAAAHCLWQPALSTPPVIISSTKKKSCLSENYVVSVLTLSHAPYKALRTCHLPVTSPYSPWLMDLFFVTDPQSVLFNFSFWVPR